MDDIKERGRIVREQRASEAQRQQLEGLKLAKCRRCGRIMDTDSGSCRWCERDQLKATKAREVPKRDIVIVLGALGTLIAFSAGAWTLVRHSAVSTVAARPAEDQFNSAAPSKDGVASQPSDIEMLTYSQTKTKEALEEKLKDPDSAKYRNVAAYRVPGFAEGYAFCGEVNAKNGFGGYSGYERFVGVPNQAFLESEVTGFGTVWNRFCDPAQIGPAIWW